MSRIVEAVGVAISHAMRGDNPERANAIETAMTEAVKKAQVEGITDPNIIRELILKARDTATGEG